jgi:hypothetical protein
MIAAKYKLFSAEPKASRLVRSDRCIDPGQITGKNEAACAADAAREVVERWLPNG